MNKLEIEWDGDRCVARAEGFNGVLLTCPRCKELLPRDKEHSCGHITAKRVIESLSDVSGLPKHRGNPGFRTIYESGEGPRLKPSGRFHLDFATFPGGITGDIPRSVIAQLERDGYIKRAFADRSVNAWVKV